MVAADHGVAFPHARERRRLSRTTAREIAPIPLFIKAPGQKTAKVNRSWVETIDILPTILDILNVDPKVHMDGKSAYSPTVKHRKHAPVRDPEHVPDAQDPGRDSSSASARRSSPATTGCSARAPTGRSGSTRSARTPS